MNRGVKRKNLEAEVGSFFEVENIVSKVFEKGEQGTCIGLDVREIGSAQYGDERRFEVIYDLEGEKIKEVREAEDTGKLKERLVGDFKLTFSEKYIQVYGNTSAVGIYNSKKDEQELRKLYDFGFSQEG